MAESSCSDSSSPTNSNEKTQLFYRCKRCRQIVASQENVVSHEQGKGVASFGSRRRRDEDEPEPVPQCTNIFVEPLKWMETVHEGYVWDKLYCMGCKYRLGSFDWAGTQCSCGTWVIPSFKILKSRVDECCI